MLNICFVVYAFIIALFVEFRVRLIFPPSLPPSLHPPSPLSPPPPPLVGVAFVHPNKTAEVCHPVSDHGKERRGTVVGMEQIKGTTIVPSRPTPILLLLYTVHIPFYFVFTLFSSLFSSAIVYFSFLILILKNICVL